MCPLLWQRMKGRDQFYLNHKEGLLTWKGISKTRIKIEVKVEWLKKKAQYMKSPKSISPNPGDLSNCRRIVSQGLFSKVDLQYLLGAVIGLAIRGLVRVSCLLLRALWPSAPKAQLPFCQM